MHTMENRFDTVNSVLTLLPRGEIDHHSAPLIRAEADALIERHAPRVLVLDLSHITFCDSSGLGLIMGRYKKVVALGGRLIVLDPTPEISRIIALSGLDKLIPTERSHGNVKA